ncbi:MAG: SDR family oxidoreductase [Gammaproteobacteria bacterium]|nr:SDR family oxidoreductase [Gammaproteobacteria bacterium]
MELIDKIAVITGGSGGIGQAMARAFLAQGARAVVIADLDPQNVTACAAEIGCDGLACDVTDEDDVKRLVDFTLDKYGQVDLYCSNAGAIDPGSGGLTDAANDVWQRQWDLHVMAHIYAARAVLPGMIARRSGCLLVTASAAGLLAALGSGPYTVTKAAAIKFAECVAITHGDDGVKAAVLCPQGVNTAMVPKNLGDGQTDGILEPEVVADIVVDALRKERFYVLPHPEVAEYVRRKGNDIDRWISGMQRLRRHSKEQH